MSSENDDRSSPHKATETNSQTQKGSKISYTRDFLLSLSELEISKKLPSGFDKSILSEFEDSSYGNQDRQRIQGSLTSQGFRRIEYSLSPPTRGDSGNHSRGIYRWDSRSSARSDRDGDSQSDRDSDSGRRYSNQSRRSWQGPQHDGLLGSGSYPRPSGFAAGISTTKIQTSDTYQLNKSNEPYHPPRPYKAVPLSRRDGHDSYNDETFGSSESMSEDRVEEEKRRRASFELMRKEQQKALQEKQKINLEKQPTDSASDISTLLADNKMEKKAVDGSNEPDVASSGSISSVDSGKSALPSQTMTFRPLVPPGFTNMAQEKNSGPKSSVHSHSPEVAEIEECQLHASAQNGALGSSQNLSLEDTTVGDPPSDGNIMHTEVTQKCDWIAESSLILDNSSTSVGLEELLSQTSILPEVHESSVESEVVDLNSKVPGVNLGSEYKENETTSILEKIFGNSVTVNVSNSAVRTEHHDDITDERWSPNTVHSSKFAHWFLEEERKTDGDHSSIRPNDLLSLIVGSDKSKSHVSDMNGSDNLQPQFPYQSSELTEQSTMSLLSTANGVSESLQNSSKQDIVQNILTCEDLEQTILWEYGEMGPNLQPTSQGLNITSAKPKNLRAPVDDQASQHLLSLLQKGTSHDIKQKIHADVGTSENSVASDFYNVGVSLHKTSDDDAQDIKDSGKALTLENLFGTAFMKELQSVQAPVSVQRGLVGSPHANTLGPQGLAFPVKDNGAFPSAVDPIRSEKTSDTKNFLASNSRQQMMLDKAQNWVENDNLQVDFNLTKDHPGVASKHGGFDGAVDYHLPEEENFMAANDNLSPQLAKFLASSNSRQNETLSSNASGDISEKLAAIGVAIGVERSALGSDGPPFVHGPLKQIERDVQHHDRHAQTSSPYFHLQQAGHGRPLIQQLDPHPTHMTSQVKFMGSERMIQHDVSGNQHFPTNMFRPPFHHHPNAGVANFELPGHQPMLQQMQLPGSYPPQLVNDFPGSTAIPHLSSQAPGIMQEPNSIPGYPFRPLQPNIGGLGMPIPAPDSNFGANRPDAFQRLLNMERRANAKQMPPYSGHSQGMYGHGSG